MENTKIKGVIDDDNNEFSSILSEYLENQNDYEVVGIARDGLQTVDFITKFEPDVLILDIIMSLLDGIGVLERINSMTNTNVPKSIVNLALPAAVIFLVIRHLLY